MPAAHPHDDAKDSVLHRPDIRWLTIAGATTLVTVTWWTIDMVTVIEIMDRSIQRAIGVVLAVVWCATVVRRAERRVLQRIERLANTQQWLVDAEIRRQRNDVRAEAVIDELAGRRARATGTATVSLSRAHS